MTRSSISTSASYTFTASFRRPNYRPLESLDDIPAQVTLPIACGKIEKVSQ
jgi:hypothetical protein